MFGDIVDISAFWRDTPTCVDDVVGDILFESQVEKVMKEKTLNTQKKSGDTKSTQSHKGGNTLDYNHFVIQPPYKIISQRSGSSISHRSSTSSSSISSSSFSRNGGGGAFTFRKRNRSHPFLDGGYRIPNGSDYSSRSEWLGDNAKQGGNFLSYGFQSSSTSLMKINSRPNPLAFLSKLRSVLRVNRLKGVRAMEHWRERAIIHDFMAGMEQKGFQEEIDIVEMLMETLAEEIEETKEIEVDNRREDRREEYVNWNLVFTIILL